MLDAIALHFYTRRSQSTTSNVTGWTEQRSGTTLRITVNEAPKEIDSGITVAQLLEQLKLESRYLAVERNRELVPRSEHARCVLEPNDRLEIVTLVGGG